MAEERISEGNAYREKTWNVVVGCSRVSAGCDNCYAIPESIMRRLAGNVVEGAKMPELLGENRNR